MTPQEISDYKRNWLLEGIYSTADTHTDVRNQCKEWCKLNCFKQEWQLKFYTEVYQDTFAFHCCGDYIEFKEWYHNAFPWSC